MPLHRPTYDCVLIGGGVIGLSLAWELSRRGRDVCVLDRGEPGQAASWAGAGILPPGSDSPEATPLERFFAHSSRLHPKWSKRLREETGIDNGYRRCGGYYLAASSQRANEKLSDHVVHLMDRQTPHKLLSADDRNGVERMLGHRPSSGFFLPDEAQIRNPRHLKALRAALAGRGVTVLADTPAQSIRTRGDRIEAIETPSGTLAAADYCFTTGCWTGEFARQIGCRIKIKPVRGQMVLLKGPRPPFDCVVNYGLRYFVPRDDGRVLVGSTMEDVGFDCSTTADGIRRLLRFVTRRAPLLAHFAVESTWAGLRPFTVDDLPILGRSPSLQNAWIASGHFRNGLTLSTATAECMAQLLCGEATTTDLRPFAPSRAPSPPPASSEVAPHRRPRATHGA